MKSGQSISGIATVNNSNGADIHSRPNEKSRMKQHVPPGTDLPFFTQSFDWFEVTMLNGDSGWIKAADVAAAFTPAAIAPIPLNLGDAIITIDAGHGGSASGAVAPDGYTEKEANLSIALKLRQLLLNPDNGNEPAGRVWMTRKSDQDVSLAYRADMGTASGGHLFISIHNNADSTAVAHGTETYFQCGSEQTAETKSKSYELAVRVQTHLLFAINASNCTSAYDRGVKCRLGGDGQDYYYVLRNTMNPSILAECVFLSNPSESACLEQDAFRQQIALGLYNGIVAYLKNRS